MRLANSVLSTFPSFLWKSQSLRYNNFNTMLTRCLGVLQGLCTQLGEHPGGSELRRRGDGGQWQSHLFPMGAKGILGFYFFINCNCTCNCKARAVSGHMQRGRRAECGKRWWFYLCSRGELKPGTGKSKGAKSERRMWVSGVVLQL